MSNISLKHVVKKHRGERGRHYLEAHFGASDLQSTLGSSSEEDMQKQIKERAEWLNNLSQKSFLGLNMG